VSSPLKPPAHESLVVKNALTFDSEGVKYLFAVFVSNQDSGQRYAKLIDQQDMEK
jgi:hypothetical protein